MQTLSTDTTTFIWKGLVLPRRKICIFSQFGVFNHLVYLVLEVHFDTFMHNLTQKALPLMTLNASFLKTHYCVRSTEKTQVEYSETSISEGLDLCVCSSLPCMFQMFPCSYKTHSNIQMTPSVKGSQLMTHWFKLVVWHRETSKTCRAMSQ